MFHTGFSPSVPPQPQLCGVNSFREEHPKTDFVNRTGLFASPSNFRPGLKSDAYVVNPSLSTNEGLDKYFAVLNNHLHQSERFAFSNTTPQNPMGSPGQTGSMRKLLISQDGRRLPSVLKKAVPLPPEDIRAVPHMRSPARAESPPVVSVGMTDYEGIPVPWTRTPELQSATSNAPSGPLGHRKSSPSADELRLTIRDDFDALEAFIEQAFSGSKSVN